MRARFEGELALPLLPNTAVRVLAACQDEESGLEELAELLAHDPSLTAHLLRVANSVGYAPRVPILSLQQAIGRVGLATVRDVAVAVALEERVFSVPGHQERVRELWLHAAATAYYAKEIAQLLRKDLDSPFLCGLLHDVGLPITLQVVCDLEREGLVAPVSAAGMELAMSAFHAEVGARIARAWNLGPWLELVIRHHHDPARARFHPEELPVVALADALADWAVDASLGEEDFAADAELLAALRLHEGALGSLLSRRGRVLEAVAALA